MCVEHLLYNAGCRNSFDLAAAHGSTAHQPGQSLADRGKLKILSNQPRSSYDHLACPVVLQEGYNSYEDQKDHYTKKSGAPIHTEIEWEERRLIDPRKM